MFTYVATIIIAHNIICMDTFYTSVILQAISKNNITYSEYWLLTILKILKLVAKKGYMQYANAIMYISV